MDISIVSAAKRLSFAFLVTAALGGCAVYQPGYAGAYAPYAQGDPYVYSQPAYVAPPVHFDFGFESRHRFHGHRHGFHHGSRGHGHGHGFRSHGRGHGFRGR